MGELARLCICRATLTGPRASRYCSACSDRPVPATPPSVPAAKAPAAAPLQSGNWSVNTATS